MICDFTQMLTYSVCFTSRSLSHKCDVNCLRLYTVMNFVLNLLSFFTFEKVFKLHPSLEIVRGSSRVV